MKTTLILTNRIRIKSIIIRTIKSRFRNFNCRYCNFTSISQIINFTINGDWTVDENWNSSCSAEEGMTWAEWVESEYNTNGIYATEYWVMSPGGAGVEIGYLGEEGNVAVEPGHTIIANCVYILSE
jgi:hypothetical protein